MAPYKRSTVTLSGGSTLSAIAFGLVKKLTEPERVCNNIYFISSVISVTMAMTTITSSTKRQGCIIRALTNIITVLL